MKSFAIGDLVTVNAARYTSPYTTVYVGRKVVGVALPNNEECYHMVPNPKGTDMLIVFDHEIELFAKASYEREVPQNEPKPKATREV
jgi:hypothetical protein